MALIPKIIDTTLIRFENLRYKQEHRDYLGMSQIGHECNRFIYYSFWWAFDPPKISARIKRIFNRGHNEEKIFYHYLNEIGVKTWGDQEEITIFDGLIKGHIDGKCIGVPEAPKTIHLLELKTMNEKNFKEVCKKTVKISHPIYYIQMQCYMERLKLNRALFLAVNKNDDSYYPERVKKEPGIAKAYFNKALTIITGDSPPEKVFAPSYYKCKMCNAYDVCHGNEEYSRNCRTCAMVWIDGGKFFCGLENPTFYALPIEYQKLGCNNYTPRFGK